MFIEDYAHKFSRYVNRLTAGERPMSEMLETYFMNDLQKFTCKLACYDILVIIMKKVFNE